MLSKEAQFKYALHYANGENELGVLKWQSLLARDQLRLLKMARALVPHLHFHYLFSFPRF